MQIEGMNETIYSKLLSFRFFKCLVLLLLFTPILANATVQAYLVNDDYECESDHMVFESSYGYILAEWFSGALHSGNYFYSDFHGYGFRDIYSSQTDAENEANSIGRIWVDDYMVDSGDAASWCNQS